jgi:hypothetical protein
VPAKLFLISLEEDMSKRTKNRTEVSQESLDSAYANIAINLKKKLKKHGIGSWLSRHEILGIIEEEVYELLMVVHDKEPQERLIEELADVAVAAIFGIACVINGSLEW